jgi:hypothetical protein
MRKLPVAVGIFLLVLTPILLASYNVSHKTYDTLTERADTASDQSRWGCAGNFSANDTILVDLLQNMFWANNTQAFDLVNNVPTFYLDVSITDPKKGVSQYELEYTYHPTDPSQKLEPYSGNVTSVGEGINTTVAVLSNFRTPSGLFIVGRATVNGTYVANVTFAGAEINYVTDDPELTPAVFALWFGRTVTRESQPYAILLPFSFVTLPVGVIFLVYGLKNTYRKRKRAKK